MKVVRPSFGTIELTPKTLSCILYSKSREGRKTLADSPVHAEVSHLCEVLTGEFDPGSERTLAAGLTHASRTRMREQSL